MGKKGLAIVTLLVLGGCIGATYKPPQTETWRRLRATDFPARVVSVDFPDGTSMNSSSHAAPEKWRIRIQNEDALATFVGCNDQACPTIDIGGLTCRYLERTAAMEEQPCNMLLSYDRVARASSCVARDTEGEVLVEMGCPAELQFKSKYKREGW